MSTDRLGVTFQLVQTDKAGAIHAVADGWTSEWAAKREAKQRNQKRRDVGRFWRVLGTDGEWVG